METQSLLPKVFYTLKETPWYFGAYLNQARHNLFLVLNDLTIKLGFKPIANDDELIGCKAISILKEDKPDPVLLEKAMEYYERKLPFLFAMHYKYSNEEEKNLRKEARDAGKRLDAQRNIINDPKRYYEILKLIIESLYEARNHFSHYTDFPFVITKDLEYLLNDCFDVNVRIVKHRFNLNDPKQTEHLRRYEDTKNREKPVKKKNFRYSFTANDGSMEISEAGLAFFTAMFLPKGDAYLFLKKISGLKRNDSPEFKATVETFCVNTIWLPKERIESDNSAQSGFLDMVNELAKCPKELFEHLSPEKQAMFISKNKEKEDEGLIEISNEDVDEPEQESKMVRKNNRFTFFAQRYFDIMGSFPNLRFAVDLGTYYYSIYPKLIAGDSVIRQLTKHLIGYGRLEDFDKDKRPESFAKLYKDISPLNTEQREPYIKETYPHYDVENNVVPFYLTDKENAVYWPVTNTIPTTGEKSYPNKIIKDSKPKPFAYLSAMELPTVLFYDLIRNGEEVQKVILNHISNVKEFFQKLKNGEILPVSKELMQKPEAKTLKERTNVEYNKRFTALGEILKQYELKPQYIPDRIVEILLAVAPADWKMNAKQRLKRMIDETYMLIDRMEEREAMDIKPGKKAFRKIKVGKLADLLAEDMMLMQPTLADDYGKNIVSSKANTTAFRLLQSRLAYFGQHKNTIKDIFKACNLIDSKNPHPFLNKISIEDKRGIIEYYKAYFIEKAKYIENCFAKADYANYYFLKAKQDKHDIQALTSAYLSLNGKKNEDYTASLLPRGLFFEKSMQWLAQNGSDVMKKYNKDFSNNSNSVHLINYYFENELNDKEQDFYNWQRSYKLFTKKQGIKDLPVYLNVNVSQKLFHEKQQEVKKYAGERHSFKVGVEKIKRDLHGELKPFDNIGSIKNFITTKYAIMFPPVTKIKWDYIRNQAAAVKEICKKLDEAVEEREKSIKDFQYYLDNEKYLRLAAVQDKLMFMCVQKMLQNKTGDISISNSEGIIAEENTFLLKNIVAVNDTSNKNILDCTPVNGISMSFIFYEPDTKGNSQKNKKAGTVTIKDKHLKIKNAGNFKRLVRDRRLNNLCFYFKPDNKESIELNRMVLENELRDYDKLRPSVLKKIADFEKKMYQANIEKANELFYKNDGVQDHKLYLKEYFKLHPESEINNLQNKLIAIRNGFVHNQYPFIKDDSFAITSVGWQTINDIFKPSEKGSTKGYGIIEKISLFASNAYQQLTDTIK